MGILKKLIENPDGARRLKALTLESKEKSTI